MNSAVIKRFIETEIRPKVRNDGGDITFESLDESADETVVRLAAHADCATCAATDQCLKWWIEQELARVTGKQVRVVIEKRPPYFTRNAA